MGFPKPEVTPEVWSEVIGELGSTGQKSGKKKWRPQRKKLVMGQEMAPFPTLLWEATTRPRIILPRHDNELLPDSVLGTVTYHQTELILDLRQDGGDMASKVEGQPEVWFVDLSMSDITFRWRGIVLGIFMNSRVYIFNHIDGFQICCGAREIFVHFLFGCELAKENWVESWCCSGNTTGVPSHPHFFAISHLDDFSLSLGKLKLQPLGKGKVSCEREVQWYQKFRVGGKERSSLLNWSPVGPGNTVRSKARGNI